MTTAHLASIPGREESLRRVVDSLLPQVDHVYIALNGHTEIPETMIGVERVTMEFRDNKNGDAEKFSFLNRVEGFVIIVDDDLVFPKFFVDIMRNKVKTHKCPVSFHGKCYANRPIESYRKSFTSNYRCLGGQIGSHMVDIIGTGTLAFNVDMVKLSMEDFPYPNMGEVWFSKVCFEQGVTLMTVEHMRGDITYIQPETTIWRDMSDGIKETEILNLFLK